MQEIQLCIEVCAHKTILTLQLFIVVFIPSQNVSDRANVYYAINVCLFLRFFKLDFGTVPPYWNFVIYISFLDFSVVVLFYFIIC